MAEQPQALKFLSEGIDVCLVSNGIWQFLCYQIAALCGGLYKLGGIYARMNASLVDRI